MITSGSPAHPKSKIFNKLIIRKIYRGLLAVNPKPLLNLRAKSGISEINSQQLMGIIKS
jgi:hypothetical protein